MADNPIVFFDVTLAFSNSMGGLRPVTLPRNAKFHRVIKGFMLQGGDFINGDGTGCMSIYGDKSVPSCIAGPKPCCQLLPCACPFLCNWDGEHTEKGLLSMANSGPGTNGCQFFVTVAPAAWLDGKHVVFGKVIDGYNVVTKIENTTVTGDKNMPVHPVVISQCGQM
eukprot:gene5846-1042_t